jgi:hypothetical protein
MHINITAQVIESFGIEKFEFLATVSGSLSASSSAKCSNTSIARTSRTASRVEGLPAKMAYALLYVFGGYLARACILEKT